MIFNSIEAYFIICGIDEVIMSNVVDFPTQFGLNNSKIFILYYISIYNSRFH